MLVIICPDSKLTVSIVTPCIQLAEVKSCKQLLSNGDKHVDKETLVPYLSIWK